MKSTIILASNNEKSFSKEIVNKLIDILTQFFLQEKRRRFFAPFYLLFVLYLRLKVLRCWIIIRHFNNSAIFRS